MCNVINPYTYGGDGKERWALKVLLCSIIQKKKKEKKDTGIDLLLRVLSSTLARTPILPTHRLHVHENSIFFWTSICRLSQLGTMYIIFLINEKIASTSQKKQIKIYIDR